MIHELEQALKNPSLLAAFRQLHMQLNNVVEPHTGRLQVQPNHPIRKLHFAKTLRRHAREPLELIVSTDEGGNAYNSRPQFACELRWGHDCIRVRRYVPSVGQAIAKLIIVDTEHDGWLMDRWRKTDDVPKPGKRIRYFERCLTSEGAEALNEQLLGIFKRQH